MDISGQRRQLKRRLCSSPRDADAPPEDDDAAPLTKCQSERIRRLKEINALHAEDEQDAPEVEGARFRASRSPKVEDEMMFELQQVNETSDSSSSSSSSMSNTSTGNSVSSASGACLLAQPQPQRPEQQLRAPTSQHGPEARLEPLPVCLVSGPSQVTLNGSASAPKQRAELVGSPAGQTRANSNSKHTKNPSNSNNTAYHHNNSNNRKLHGRRFDADAANDEHSQHPLERLRKHHELRHSAFIEHQPDQIYQQLNQHLNYQHELQQLDRYQRMNNPIKVSAPVASLTAISGPLIDCGCEGACASDVNTARNERKAFEMRCDAMRAEYNR